MLLLTVLSQISGESMFVECMLHITIIDCMFNLYSPSVMC